MAATHLTLEETAQQLGLSPEEFKRRLKTDPAFKVLVPIRDGVNLRFKPAAVEELARQLGLASNPELPLAAMESPGLDSDDFRVPAAGKAKSDDEPLLFADSSEDVFPLAADPPPAKKPGKPGSDSDIRLEGGKAKKAKGDSDSSDAAIVPTEEIAIDVAGPGSAVIKGGSSSKLSAPKSGGKLSASDSGKNLANPGTGDSSEFELSLDADSDDFELKLNTESSDEVNLGEIPSEKRGGESGINLRDPADSGISLEKGKGKEKAKPKPTEESDSDVDFELTLDSSSGSAGLKLGGLKASEATDPDSDSEFELTLDDSGDSGLEHAALAEGDAEKRDIFETDFEIPPMEGSDSGSEVVAIDSDTDLDSGDLDMAIEESDVVEETSGSEVVLLDDEEAPAKGKKGKKGKAAADVDLADVDLADEDDASASKALKGVKGRRRADEEEEDEEEETVPSGAVAARPIPWGPLPALLLLPALLFMLAGALIGYEMLQTMSGYQQPRKPAAPIARELAKTLDMPLADQ